MKQVLVAAILLFGSVSGFGQDTLKNEKIKPFIAYDLGQAVYNRFQSISGEVGLRLSNDRLIRITHMNVNYVEAHLERKKAIPLISPQEGGDVEGSIFGFETFYSLPVYKRPGRKEALYLSPSFGYYKKKYWHTKLNERFSNRSFLVGLEISYREYDLFKVKGLYYNVTLPLRFNFTPHGKRMLGETKILGDRIDTNSMFFV
ncbi:MAG: hypothetical protein AAF551_09670, partial [Bacteroidota bacterium]